MTNPLSATELARLQSTQESHMFDTCVPLVWDADGGGTDDYGNDLPGWTEANAIPCGFDPEPGREVLSDSEVAIWAARIRLPLTANVNHRNRWRITHRFGVELSDKPEYEAIGQPQRGPSGYVVNLRLVTDGSTDG